MTGLPIDLNRPLGWTARVCALLAAVMGLSAAHAQPPPATQPEQTESHVRQAVEKPRLLFLLADGFNVQEHYGALLPLLAAGYVVDVAGLQVGPVYANRERPGERDTLASISLDEVRPERYLGLVIPGGYSPGLLEKHPAAISICQAFFEAGKPVAAICHGPRLLMRAGLLRQRNMTCLHSVANELADEWKDRAYGRYFDQPVVIDRNLITSRYPNDVPDFTRATLAILARQPGGLPMPSIRGARVLVAAPASTGHSRWLAAQLSTLGAGVRVLDDRAILALEQADPEADPALQADLILLLDPPTEKAVDESASAAVLRFAAKTNTRILAAGTWPMDPADLAERPIFRITEPGLAPALRQTVRLLESLAAFRPVEAIPGEAPAIPRLPEAWPAPAVDRAGLVLALTPGFDELVLARLLNDRRAKPWGPVYALGPSRGPVGSLNNVTVRVAAAYADHPDLPAGSIVIAPGGLWPRKAPARQATQPAWVDQQAELDLARHNWLLRQLDAGCILVAFGMDAWMLGSDTRFASRQIATSDQMLWSFPRDAGRYAPAHALLSTDRFITAKGPQAIPEVLSLIETLLRDQP